MSSTVNLSIILGGIFIIVETLSHLFGVEFASSNFLLTLFIAMLSIAPQSIQYFLTTTFKVFTGDSFSQFLEHVTLSYILLGISGLVHVPVPIAPQSIYLHVPIPFQIPFPNFLFYWSLERFLFFFFLRYRVTFINQRQERTPNDIAKQTTVQRQPGYKRLVPFKNQDPINFKEHTS